MKNPRSLLMLPYWRQKFPRLRFIHVIRNGLDMAYSEDKNQLEMFQDMVLTAQELEFSLPLRAIAYWRSVNLAAADYGAAMCGSPRDSDRPKWRQHRWSIMPHQMSSNRPYGEPSPILGIYMRGAISRRNAMFMPQNGQ